MTGEKDRSALVLVLHRVVARRERDHDVRPGSFRTLIDELAEGRRSFATRLEAPEPSSVVLTFDDATIDHLEVAHELANRRIAAVFFVPFGRLGHRGHLSPTGVRELVALGHRVGAHALDHAPLAGAAVGELRRQVAESQERLEEVTGAPVRYFAPPGGVGHASLEPELARAGYEASRSTRWGLYRTRDERWRVPCLPVTEHTLASGWIRAAAQRGALPVPMRAAALVRHVAPDGMRTRLRRSVHAGY
jgi:peptidoglycan/xylan/chitin deacetylase (PgdA/CDA1 family)